MCYSEFTTIKSIYLCCIFHNTDCFKAPSPARVLGAHATQQPCNHSKNHYTFQSGEAYRLLKG